MLEVAPSRREWHVEEMKEWCHSQGANKGLEKANWHCGHVSAPHAEGSKFISINDRFAQNRVLRGDDLVLSLIKF
jgi:hypothetical protein